MNPRQPSFRHAIIGRHATRHPLSAKRAAGPAAILALVLLLPACSTNNTATAPAPAPGPTTTAPAQPPALVSNTTQSFSTSEPTMLTISNTGGSSTSCDLATGVTLPDGLKLMLVDGTCRISGTPTSAFATTTVSIIATNATGSSMVTVTISAQGATSPPSPPPAQSSDTLIWSDEFDGAALDTEGNWDIEMGRGPGGNGWGNNELQSYTGDPVNLRVRDGHLEIIATATGSGDSRQYRSARIRTKGKQTFRYPEGGTIRIEARMTLPGGKGLWPAFWMLPEDSVHGGWPRSGEIDIMEAINLGVDDRNITSFAAHYGMPWPLNAHSTDEHNNAASPETEFHTYAVEWQRGQIRWYINDEHVHTQASQHWYTLSYRNDLLEVLADGEPFTQPFHLLLNVAVGGNFPGPVGANTQFPQMMRVDWVRVHNCATDPASSRCYKGADSRPHNFATSGFTNGNTARTLTLTAFEDGLGSYTEGSATTAIVATTDGDGITADTSATDATDQVAQLTFTDGDSSIAFSPTGEMVALDATGAERFGQIEFDLKVLEVAPGTGLSFRIIDSAGNALQRNYSAAQLNSIKDGAGGKRRQVLTLHQLTNSNSFQYDSVAQVFAVHSTGSFGANQQTVVQIDDIRLHVHCPVPARNEFNCGLSTESRTPAFELDVTPDTTAYPNTLSLYDDGFNAASGITELSTFSDPAGGVTASEVNVTGRGKVIQCQASGQQAICGIKAPDNQTADLSAFAGTGFIEFDIRFVTPPTDTTATLDFKYELPDVFSRDIQLAPATSFTSWRRVRVDLNNTVWRTDSREQYDLSKVRNFHWFPAYGKAAGAIWQIDNITLYRP